MITLALLIGGRGTRLGGVDKASLRVGSSGLGENALAQFRHNVQDVMLVGRSDQQAHPLASQARFVIDTVADEGPLRGIATALANAETPWVFVFATDILGAADDLTQLWEARTRGDLAIAFRDEPLCALYAKALQRTAENLLTSGERRASMMLHNARQLSRTAPLSNINTPADLSLASQPKP